MSFGERLAQARKEQNMTVKALAAACWTSTTVIHHYEKGRRMPSAELLIGFATHKGFLPPLCA